MDYVLKKRALCSTQEILDTVLQQAVDLDFTLPDYCPDIEKILKCSLVPKIYTRSLSAGQLRIDGASVVRVLYCDSQKNALRCCEQTLPFSATVPVNSDIPENIILTTAKPEYLNCRALSQRRLSVHGAFSLYASVIGKKIFDVFEEAEDSCLQIKCENKEVCELCEFTQEQLSINESVSISAKNNIETIVRSQLTALVTDYKESGDKLILSGEITLRMLYVCDSMTGETDQFIYVFPFTQSIGALVQGCDIADVRLDVLCYDLMLRSEMLSEEPLLNIDVKLCASFLGYKKQSLTYISDAYSVKDNTELSFEAVPLCCDILSVVADGVVKAPVSLGDKNVRKIIDIFCEEPSLTVSISDNIAQFKGKANVCIIALTEGDELICVERPVDIDVSHTLDKTYGYAKNPAAQITSLSFRMSDNNQLELRLDMRLSALLGTVEAINQVTEAKKTGEADFDNNCALTLYYARGGERVWDIAKAYKTPIESICSENSLCDELLSEDRMLLILRA
ncbi:MAG: DUF3794 domain-containing protein [Ruminococcus sp.]|nr:DUF3794 domain-containing protein [Ruminococcus sp.]